MQLHSAILPMLAVLAARALGIPMPDASQDESLGKQLWMSTPETTQPPAGIPANYALQPARRAQPPSGAHVAAPKDRDTTDEFAHIARFDKATDLHARAPGYQNQTATIKGIVSALDPNQQSALDGGNPLAFKSKTHPYTPNTRLFDQSKFKLPLPTNRWWLNLMIEQGADPIHPYPYVVKCMQNASSVGFPRFNIDQAHVTSDQPADWTVGDGNQALTQRKVTGADALGVEVTWTGSSGAQMCSRFYKGMAFQTFEMQNMAPRLTTIHAVLKVEQLTRAVLSAQEDAAQVQRDVSDMPLMTKVTLNDGSQWLVTSKPGITWQQQGSSTLQPQNINGSYTGFVQLAHLGDQPANNINVLQRYAGTYPTAGAVTYAQVQGSDGTGRSSNVVFMYQTNTAASSDSTHVYNTSSVSTTMQLLSFVLPHHADHINGTSILSNGLSGYRCAKGPLTAVAGNLISYNQPLQQRPGFAGPGALADSDKSQLQQQLLRDAATSTNVTAEDPYFFGKGAAKVARLYQIAQEVGDATTAAALGKKLVALLTPWLVAQSNSDPLVYDSTWGGVVSTLGISDPSLDFGQGRYNDHHFHYGYFLYAGAVLAKYDVNAFAPLREPLSQLLRDYANPSASDAQFPFMRHFDPYDGHSWAAGLFTFADGRNQESTGEALNAYYAAYLYAQALGLQETAEFYEIILNMEAASGRRYWHPTRAQAAQLYGKPFVHNAVGILWSSKADYVTFFGANPEYVYGIQMLPFTPASGMLIKQDWVREAWCPDNSTCADGMKPAAQSASKNGWAQFLYTAYALVDRNAALDNAAACTPDDGNTLTNTLHWIYTSQQLAIDSN
ncbi:hypothetical protein IWW54_003693 [Coemansia sp. RSA 2705]|nr:hypothetical protein IWW54_003693 [Coemansia sp. RSA 2705]